jgi:hypothetical protein
MVVKKKIYGYTDKKPEGFLIGMPSNWEVRIIRGKEE